MCACIELLDVEHSPGGQLAFWEEQGISRRLRWAGFARHEILDWWLRQGARLVDVPAERFATRSDVSGELVWSDIPRGCVIRGLVDSRGPRAELRIVTRAAHTLELLHCQHERMPLVEQALFSAEAPPTVGLPLFESCAIAEEHPGELVQELLL